jgi:excinuclease ABC subunit C
MPKKKCLYYDIGQCLGPCINKITYAEYEPYIKQLGEFFKGKPQSLLKYLSQKEDEASKKLNYEEAKRILTLSNQLKESSKEMATSQTVNLKNNRNTDVVGYHLEQQYITIVIFSYINGKLLTKFQQIAEIHDEVDETLAQFLMQYYQNSYNKPTVCYINLQKDTLKSLSETIELEFINPISGKYRTIIQSAANNAKKFYDSNLLVYQKKRQITTEAFNDLRKTLNLDNLSLIHVFDMSNLFGKDKVGSMIALENGAYNKNLYRKFIIKDLNATSDYAYTYEVVKRQYTKMIKTGAPLPNLIIADGGIIQINAIKKALNELHIDKIVPVIGLVKDNHHRTDAIVIDTNRQISLDRKSNLYTYLFNIQEEVHRYAISFFRKRFKDSAFKSILDDIPGLGSKSVAKLLAHYDNVANIKQASLEELKQYVSEKIAKEILKRG